MDKEQKNATLQLALRSAIIFLVVAGIFYVRYLTLDKTTNLENNIIFAAAFACVLFVIRWFSLTRKHN